MTKTWDAFSSKSSVTGWLRNFERSMPWAARTSTASRLAGAPWGALSPAEKTRTSSNPADMLRNSASAIGLRQTFPVQMNKTLRFDFWLIRYVAV
jgi:hypothetical protein